MNNTTIEPAAAPQPMTEGTLKLIVITKLVVLLDAKCEELV